MLKGFKEFISRGNVIDLAVAVVIGAAFTALVTAFTDSVVQPLIDRIGAGQDEQYGILRIPIGGEQFIDLNTVLAAIINFLLVALVLYFVIVVPYKKLKERDTKVEEEDTELTLLTEIRDLLQQNAVGDTVGRHGTPPQTRSPE
ncbi:large-conductance mechanosensitive channel protein MscL [[Mycobacterium] burgundiense]|uniref:Large-conductance mechanosensitive channel n=1 Tax=[Mycobacterium] burgundiense TaxID=3064286 RepID=A0ABM9LDI2_9MYCO|nr:large-conductance mechanosensitive channel protein MscL [Mycolicibacterium sp. MU0053]CAJ1497176.1 large-conductance mechanosensitive channel protein MscL [Mycolicibacterium sp. MU0053]